MQRIPLQADERTILGKKVKNLRKDGLLPAHVFGNKLDTEHVSVKLSEFLKVYSEAGETGLIDLKIGVEKVRPVMVKGVQKDPVSGDILHADFYQVNLSEKVKVPVPVILIGEDPELVGSGEAVVIQPVSEIEVEALPTDLIESIEVDKSTLKAIGDSILVSQLQVPATVTILTDPESVVVKLDTAITEEMKKLMEEEEAEKAAAAAAAAEAQAPAEGVAAPSDAANSAEVASATKAGEAMEGKEGETAEAKAEGGEAPKEEQPQEEKKE